MLSDTRPLCGSTLGAIALAAIVTAWMAAMAIATPVKAATASPVCPASYTYSRLDRACVSVQAPTCSKPFKWDPARKGCFMRMTATCPNGYIFERVASMCRPSNLSSGGSTVRVAPNCPSGYTLTGRTCHSITSSPPICPSGFSFDARGGNCMRSRPASCPNGYRLDIVRGVCSTGPVHQ
jgi:hypothetical protein